MPSVASCPPCWLRLRFLVVPPRDLDKRLGAGHRTRILPVQLPTRQLGSSDLFITPVGVGTAPIGSTKSWRIYWGHQDERASIRTIHAALDAGVNWIDTAPFYGWGRAEEVVGKAIADRRSEEHT